MHELQIKSVQECHELSLHTIFRLDAHKTVDEFFEHWLDALQIVPLQRIRLESSLQLLSYHTRSFHILTIFSVFGLRESMELHLPVGDKREARIQDSQSIDSKVCHPGNDVSEKY